MRMQDAISGSVRLIDVQGRLTYAFPRGVMNVKWASSLASKPNNRKLGVPVASFGRVGRNVFGS